MHPGHMNLTGMDWTGLDWNKWRHGRIDRWLEWMDEGMDVGV